MIRVAEITPSDCRDFDFIVIRMDKTESWSEVLFEVEKSLDGQWAEMEAGERELKDVAVKVQLKEISEAEMEEIESQ
jgi:hypothetical protein